MKIGNRIKDLRKSKGLTQIALATLVDVEQATISRWERSENPPDRDQMRALAKTLGTSAEFLEFGLPEKSPSSTALETNLAAHDATKTLPTVLEVRAGHWLAVEFMDEYQDDGVRVPYCEEYQEFDQFAVKVVGDSINKFAQDGDRLVCATIESGIQLVDGDHVVVEATRNGGAEVEATVKQIKMTPDGLELWPNSTNPIYTGPVKLGKNGDEVRLRGVVLATRPPVRPKPARAVRLP